MNRPNKTSSSAQVDKEKISYKLEMSNEEEIKKKTYSRSVVGEDWGKSQGSNQVYLKAERSRLSEDGRSFGIKCSCEFTMAGVKTA